MKLQSSARFVRRSCLAAAVGGTFAAATPASAQFFTGIVAFGDSYADSGNLLGLIGPSPIYPTGRFSGGTNFNDTLSAYLGVGQRNYAFGGATASSNVVSPLLPGFLQEVGAFVGTGQRISSTEVVTLSIGGNDARAYQQTGGTVAGASASAAVSAGQVGFGINGLVGAGLRTLVFTAGDTGTLPEVAGDPAAQAVRSAFSQSYNLQMQGYLANLAATGVRAEYVDLQAISAAIALNPLGSGITNLGACPVECLGNPALQTKYLFYVDGLHLTSAAFAWVAAYIQNRLYAPATFSAQGDLGVTASAGFVATMFNRLDLFGAERGPTIVPVPLAYAEQRISKNPVGAFLTEPTVSPLSVYILANGGFGSRKQNRVNAGFDYDSIGGTIGAEYRFGREAILGAAFQYSDARSTFTKGFGQTELQSYQFGLYGAWTRANFFVQGLGSIGRQDYRNARSGVLLGDLISTPSGTSATAAGKVGYLFDTGLSLFGGGSTRLGPIAGLTYVSNRIGSYVENGDLALALGVGRQRVEVLTGSAGVQLRNEFQLFGARYETFTNITAEDDLRGTGRSIRYDAASAPLIVNTFAIPNQSSRLYGKTTGGITAAIAPNVSASLTTFSTFGRRAGNDYGAQGGFKYAF